MIHYKKINLNCLGELQSYLHSHISTLIPESGISKVISNAIILPVGLLTMVNTELNSYGIPDIEYCRIYLWPKNSIQIPHVDGTDVITHCAINIPLHGGKNSKFQWLGGEFDLKLVDIVTTTQKAYAVKWRSLLKVIDSVELIDGCYLIRIDQPHQAIASPNSDRWVFTMRFKGNPTFEDLYDRVPASNL
jgi:hypothetical protein